MTQNPMTYMHGGTHYLKMGIQPFTFAMENQWDACAFSILKYVSRYRDKAGMQDLDKAGHIVEIRQAHIEFTYAPVLYRITIERFCEANGIVGQDAEALIALERWVHKKAGPETLRGYIVDLKTALGAAQ